MTKQAKKMYQAEYSGKAHWDIERPSSKLPQFMSYLKRGERILDAGCGTGRDAIFLAKKGFKVVGVDFVPLAIQKAKEKSRGLENVEFEVGDIETPLYKDASFDAVYSGYTLQHTDMNKSFSELARVLKPGGIAFFTIFLETKYDTSSKKEVIDEKNVLDIAKKNFGEILDEKIDEYYDYDDEETKEGRHKHKRLTLVLRK